MHPKGREASRYGFECEASGVWGNGGWRRERMSISCEQDVEGMEIS